MNNARIHVVGIELDLWLAALPQPWTPDRDCDLLVLGPDVTHPQDYLKRLRYRRGRRTPVAVIPCSLPQSLLASLKIPYITYGPDGHVQLFPLQPGYFVVQTPVGRASLRVSGDGLEFLIAIAVGLALRISPDDLVPLFRRATNVRAQAA